MGRPITRKYIFLISQKIPSKHDIDNNLVCVADFADAGTMPNEFAEKKKRDEKPWFVLSTWDEVHPISSIKRLPTSAANANVRAKTVSFSDVPEYFIVRRSEPVSSERPASDVPEYFELVQPKQLKNQKKVSHSILKNPIEKVEVKNKEEPVVQRKWYTWVLQESLELPYAQKCIVIPEAFAEGSHRVSFSCWSCSLHVSHCSEWCTRFSISTFSFCI